MFFILRVNFFTSMMEDTRQDDALKVSSLDSFLICS